MISTHDALATTAADGPSVWARLAAPLPRGVVAWRQDGRPIARDGRFLARFVAYIEANTVRERLDVVVPGEWDLTLDLLPPIPTSGDDADAAPCSFKARLQVLGVIREDVGTGRDYKQAATDAFKRAAVRFGIGHELYSFEPNWVAVDGEGKYARPLEDPQAAYARRLGARSEFEPAGRPSRADEPVAQGMGTLAGAPDSDAVACPKCGGRMWDNRMTKRNPKAPDFKCRDRSCDGVIWPPRSAMVPPAESNRPGDAAGPLDGPLVIGATPLAPEDIPF